MKPQPFRDECNVNLLSREISKLLNQYCIGYTTFKSWYDHIYIENIQKIDYGVKVYLRIGKDISDGDAGILLRQGLDMQSVIQDCKIRVCAYTDEADEIFDIDLESERESARKIIKQELKQMQQNAQDEIPQFQPRQQSSIAVPFFSDPKTTEKEFKECFESLMSKQGSGRKVSRLDFIKEKIMNTVKVISGKFSSRRIGRNYDKIHKKLLRRFNKLVSKHKRRLMHIAEQKIKTKKGDSDVK